MGHSVNVLNKNLAPETTRAEEVLNHIETFHHEFLRSSLPKLAPLVDKVAKVHQGRHPELIDLKECFEVLRSKLEQTVHHEKTSLFPILRQLSRSGTDWGSDCDRLRRAAQIFLRKQEKVELRSRALRQLSSDFTLPDDACPTYRLMLDGLRGLHAHLDNELNFEAVSLLPLLASMEERTLRAHCA